MQVENTTSNVSSNTTSNVSQSQSNLPQFDFHKNKTFADLKILGNPPTTLVITSSEGDYIDPEDIDDYLEKHQYEDGYLYFQAGETALLIQYFASDPNIFKIKFQQSIKAPIEEKEIRRRALSPPGMIENYYIQAVKLAAQRNDIKTGVRLEDDVPGWLYNDNSIVDKRISREYIPNLPRRLNFGKEEITNPITKQTLEVPIIVIPEGSYIYRGIGNGTSCRSVNPTYASQRAYIYYTIDLITAKAYADLENCVEVYYVKKDIKLIDLWTKPVIKEYLDIDKCDKKSTVLRFLGVNYTSKNFLENETNKRYYPSMFRGGVFQKDISGQKNQSFFYRNLEWGPEIGQYKRESSFLVDQPAITCFLKQIPQDFDGIYCVPTPSVNHRDAIVNPEISKELSRFHSEVIIRGSAINKLQVIARKQLGNTIGSGRRKTYRKKNRKHHKKTHKRSNRLSSRS
jgi:hypothetical protein